MVMVRMDITMMMIIVTMDDNFYHFGVPELLQNLVNVGFWVSGEVHHHFVQLLFLKMIVMIMLMIMFRIMMMIILDDGDDDDDDNDY